MKKRVASLFLALTLALSLAGTALAVTETTVVSKDPTNVTATLVDNQKVSITVSGLTANEQYLILMVSGLYEDASQINVTASTIRYIDQVADASGTISATVYPDSLQTSTICISGADTGGLRIVATVEVPYKVGDANLDGSRDAKDITRLARHVAKVELLTGNGLLAADVNQDGSRDAKDITRLARHVAKVELLPE